MAESQDSPHGRLAENILYFARTLRAAGLPVGPGAVLDALEALQVAHVGKICRSVGEEPALNLLAAVARQALLGDPGRLPDGRGESSVTATTFSTPRDERPHTWHVEIPHLLAVLTAHDRANWHLDNDIFAVLTVLLRSGSRHTVARFNRLPTPEIVENEN